MYKGEDMIARPPHYIGSKGLEVIDVIEQFTDGLTGIEAFYAGNIIKYACRWKKKGGLEDIKKLIQYAEYLKKRLESKGEWLSDEERLKE